MYPSQTFQITPEHEPVAFCCAQKLMSLHKHVEIHAAAQNLIDVEAVNDVVVSPVFQPVCGEFEFIDQRIGLVFKIGTVETTAIKRSVKAAAESIGVCFDPIEQVLHLHPRGPELLCAYIARECRVHQQSRC
jgi:hypothetical protein